MKFATYYYNATKLVKTMLTNEQLVNYPEIDDMFEGVYVCMDSNDFWISRINKGYNEDYEKEDDKYLVERNKISIYDVMDKLVELHHKKLPELSGKGLLYEVKNKTHAYLDKFTMRNIVEAVILLDDYDGLCNWDCCEAESLEEAILMIDG